MTNQWNPDSFHRTPGAQSLHYDITTFEGDQMATIDPSIVNGNPDIAKFLGLASKCQRPGSLFTFLTITVAMDSLPIVPSINSSIASQLPPPPPTALTTQPTINPFISQNCECLNIHE